MSGRRLVAGSSVARRLTESETARLRARAFSQGSVLERDGSMTLAFGRAETLSLPSGLSDPAGLVAVRERLAELACPEATGRELPIVVGALPFLPDRAGEVIVPEVAVVGGLSSATAISFASSELLEELLAGDCERDTVRPPDSFELTAGCPHEDFLARVAAAIDEVRSGRLEKVVLARDVVITANRPFRQSDLLERLRALHPSCLTFAIDGFLGATPELLLRRAGDQLFSDPLAGTAPRSGDPIVDRRIEEALLASEKEREEHRAVVDSISVALAPAMASLDVPPGPEIVELRNVSHLRTRIHGVLSPGPGGRIPSVLELVGRVHPTPAVAGSPVEVSLEYLAKCEDLDRDRYAGPVGWMRADGDGEFHLGIRSAIVRSNEARLFAGVGIVGDSEPEAELRETQLKFQAVLAAAVRP